MFAGKPAKPSCMQFESIEEVRAWLAGRENASSSLFLGKCISSQVGVDGLRSCSAPPHRHRILLPVEKSVLKRDELQAACDNHVQGYLAEGWVEVLEARKLCTNCGIRQADVDETCETCLDEMTRPAAASITAGALLCVNRDRSDVPNCARYAEVGGKLCAYCRAMKISSDEIREDAEKMGLRKVPNARVRTITASARPCAISKGCNGQMLATVRRYYPGEKPQLWWRCGSCKYEQPAKTVPAAPDPALVEPLSTDVQDMAAAVKAHVRTALAEPE